jgi:hypothetical protein
MKKKSEPEKRRGFILTFEPGRSEKIDAALRYGRREATETFSSVDWKLFPRELVLLSFSFGHDLGVWDETIDGVVLMERMKAGGATGKLKMRMYAPVMFENPIELKELPRALRRPKLFSTSVNLRRLEQAPWVKLLEHIKALRPNHAKKIDHLQSRQFDDGRIFPVNERTQRLMEQRDAIGTAVQVAGLDRASVLKSLDATKVHAADSVLDLLDSEPIQEQDALRIDKQAFGTLLSRGMRHARFSNSAGAEVRIHIYDHKPLESLLGIDLLIYMPLYRAFILIQYKMMKREKREDGGWYYPVDGHLMTQMSAMKRAAKQMRAPRGSPTSVGDWRLSDEVFFWKFCEATRSSDSDASLVHGITLARPHLESFLQLAESKGRSNARRVGYENCRRYLTTSDFVSLAQAGWIGGGSGARLLLEALLKQNQKEGRQTILASVAQAEKLKEIRRGWR